MVNGRKRFSEYLADAERLFLELHSNDGDGGINVVGYAIVERLSRLIEAGVIAEDLVRLASNVLLATAKEDLFFRPTPGNPTWYW